MKVAVLGSGAMGGLFGGLLAEAGENVTLVDIWKEHVDTINRKGLRITGVGTDRTVRARATSKPAEIGPVDLILIFVKSYNTKHAIENALSIVSDRTTILTLQNGLGNIEEISKVIPSQQVIGGSTTHGSTLIGPGEIYHAGKGVTVIGELNGKDSSRIRTIAGILNRAGIETSISDNVIGAIWSKVLINVGINALTALTRMRNGELLGIREIRETMMNAVEEGLRVAMAASIRLEIKNPMQTVLDVAQATADNKSSMLQDIEKGAKTEIDAINGAIVALAKKYGLETPVNKTLAAAVKGLEKSAPIHA